MKNNSRTIKMTLAMTRDEKRAVLWIGKRFGRRGLDVLRTWTLTEILALWQARTAEALSAPTIGTQLAAFSAWAGRGMRDKPEEGK